MLTKLHVKPLSKNSEDGFTLLELLAALTLIGVASSIFFSLFAASTSLAISNRSQTVAGSLAGGYLTKIMSNPDRFDWPDFDAKGYGTLHSVMPAGRVDASLLPAEPPSVHPTSKRAFDRENAMYSGYALEAFASVPSEDDSFVEVVVNVWWNEAGRQHIYSSTSCLPRYLCERAIRQ